MYSTYKPDEAFYDDDAKTYQESNMKDETDARVAPENVYEKEGGLKAYDSYSSMPRNTKLKTFFDTEHNNNYGLHNTNTSSFRNINNAE